MRLTFQRKCPCSFKKLASSAPSFIPGLFIGRKRLTRHPTSSLHQQPAMVRFAKSPPKLHEEDDLDTAQSAMAASSDEEVLNGKVKAEADEMEGQIKKRKRKSKSEKGTKLNGGSSKKKRRHSVSKPARDPRDQASPATSEPEIGTRSPSPVIDFDGLSRPSMFLFQLLQAQC